MCSQWMPSSKKASPPAIVSSLRQSSARLEPVGQRRELREHQLADRAIREQPPQQHRQRLVVVVLADHHHATRLITRRDRGVEIPQRGKRRLLDQHVLARRQRLERQRQVKGRRHRDHHRVDRGIGDRRGIRAVVADAAEAPAVRFSLRGVAAGVGAGHGAAERSHVPAVNGGDEPASEKRESQG